MTSLLPMLSFVSGKSCEEATKVLMGLVGEALNAQEVASKRTAELKQSMPKNLMELFTPEKVAAVVTANVDDLGSKGQREKPKKQQQQEQGVPVNSKKEQARKKRARKLSEKATEVRSDDEEVEVEEKPKKKSGNKKESIKRGEGVWTGEEYPRIARVVKCEEGEDGLRVDVHAKKQGRGQWQKLLFSLDSTQLRSIDGLPEKTKSVVEASFHKALMGCYDQKWPNALRLALAGTIWAKDIIPRAAAVEDKNDLDGDWLEDPYANANLSDFA